MNDITALKSVVLFSLFCHSYIVCHVCHIFKLVQFDILLCEITYHRCNSVGYIVVSRYYLPRQQRSHKVS